MTEKQNISAEQIMYKLINSMMDNADPYPLMRIAFENVYIQEGYSLDWNKRLNENGEWVDKKEVKE